MADKILPAVQTWLNSTKEVELATLVAIELPGSNGDFLTLTDYKRNLTYQSQVFITGRLKSVSGITRTAELSANTVSIKVTGVPDEEIERAMTSKSYLERVIKIWRVYLDSDGNIVPCYSDGSTILLFEGKITELSVREQANPTALGTSEITWKCANEFYELDRVNGRITNDESHRGLIIDSDGNQIPSNAAKKIEYQDDWGFYHSDQSIDILATYQTQEKQYKMVKKKSWGGLKTDYDMVEYWATVTREVDIRFNLAAKYIPVVYGVRKVQGIPIFADTYKDDPRRVIVVYAFCEGEIEGFLDFYLNDAPLICYDSADAKERACLGLRRDLGDTIGTTAVEGGEGPNGTSQHGREYIYNDGDGEVKFWTFHGKNDQEASQFLVDLAANEQLYGQTSGSLGQTWGPEYWDERFKLLDTAYVVMEVEITDNRTNVPTIHADIRGKKVSTFDADGLVSTDETSLNPAWQKLDYLRSKTYGVGLGLNRIDLDSFIEVADLFDVQDTSYDSLWTPYWRYIGWKDQLPDNRAVMQTNTSLDTDNTLFKNMDTMLKQTICSLNVVNGQYNLTVEAESQEITTIPESALLNGEVMVSDVTSKNKFNTVVAAIEDPGTAWQTNTITFFEGDYLEEDNLVEKKQNLAFPFITNYYTARSLCERELRKSRYNREVQITLPFNYIDLFINKPAHLNKARFGWENKEFLINKITYESSGKVKVTLREYTEGIFINSPKVDESENQRPSVDALVKPPRDFTYVPYEGADIASGLIGKNGELRWLPSLSADVTYYSIKVTGQLEPITVAVDAIDTTLPYIFTELYGYEAGTYTFDCRAVSTSRGLSSSPATIVVNMSAAKNLPKVDNLRLRNPTSNDPSVWVGNTPQVQWDRIPEGYLLEGGDSYLIEVLSPDDVVLSTYTTSGVLFDYPFATNKQDYFDHEGALGAYRTVKIRVKAQGPDGESSVDWTYL